LFKSYYVCNSCENAEVSGKVFVTHISEKEMVRIALVTREAETMVVFSKQAARN
jgi:hypothetical protein